jgi:hypothetical protein
LSAFRSGHGCQTALLKIIEDWKKALDDNKFVAAILMDLSKAFDCLPHNLLLLKLKTYGLSDSALDLLFSYLHQRKQCIKVENVCSNFKYMYKSKRDEDGFQRKKRADQKLFAQKILKLLEEHLLDDSLFCLADNFCS